MRLLSAIVLLAACQEPARPRAEGPPDSSRAVRPGVAVGLVAIDAGLAPVDAGAVVDLPLGVVDRGIFPDLDPAVRLGVAWVEVEAARLLLDEGHRLLVLYHHRVPAKVYPLGGEARLTVGGRELALRAEDVAELRRFAARPLTLLRPGEKAPPGDRDGDGIPDPLDLLVGGKKVAANGASYGGDYVVLSYPGGDLPRDQGKCTDVVVRAARNAGLDLQQTLHEDIAAAPGSYPFVKKADTSIDHRRVRTLLPYLVRHMEARGLDPTAAADPFLPGDIILMDTIPSKSGPDHIGILSDRYGASGLPLVINNWDEGYKEGEMELLPWVTVTHRFRFILR